MKTQKEVYREEAYELLRELEESLLELENMPNNKQLIDRCFRALHTIKGSGAMSGFDDIAGFTHDVENVFDRIRECKVKASKELISLALSARDHILSILEADAGRGVVDVEKGKEILSALQWYLVDEKESDTIISVDLPQEELVAMEMSDSATFKTYRIRFNPGPDMLKNGSNPLLLLNELRSMGEATILARDMVPELAGLLPDVCYTAWDIILTTTLGLNDIRDVFIFVEDESEIDIRLVDVLNEKESGVSSEYKKLGEILVERGDVERNVLEKALSGQQRIGEKLMAEKIVDSGKIVAAVAEQIHVRKVREQKAETASSNSLRVDSGRLDDLVDLVGELVTVQARLTQKAQAQKDSDLLMISQEVQRLSTELREKTMSIRMLPVGTTFSSFKRLVRDLTQSLGKQVVLVTEGGETELDKTVIDQLKDPLIHIIRNAVDHGIESPEVREVAGKPKWGTIRLSALHSGAHVLIEVSDDGAGLDRESIIGRAVEKRIISAQTPFSDAEVYNLIFEPGFSTAREVTDISGRGVGMDVVKRGIENLRGEIKIESKMGEGTRMILKLPLTLAIIDGLMVKIGKGFYILPLASIEACVAATRKEVEKAAERKLMNIRGEYIPYLRLRELYGENGVSPVFEQVVVAEVGGERIGLGVDHVVGQHQTVIKSLGPFYREVKGTSGATILGDGTVALIVDINAVLEISEMENAACRN